jgi:hypothetical protein
MVPLQGYKYGAVASYLDASSRSEYTTGWMQPALRTVPKSARRCKRITAVEALFGNGLVCERYGLWPYIQFSNTGLAMAFCDEFQTHPSI